MVTPSIDPIQNLLMTMAEHVDGRTNISFTRPRITNETFPTDIALDHPVYFLWATGGSVSFSPVSIDYHGGQNRGYTLERIALPSATECPPGKDNESIVRWRLNPM